MLWTGARRAWGVYCIETLGPPVVARFPSASVTACVSSTVRVGEMARVSERPCVRGTACMRSLCVREMMVGMREHAAASPSVSVMGRCVSVVARGSLSAWIECRRRRRQMDKGRVAAVAITKTAPGLHGSEREVRAVLRRGRPVLSCVSETRSRNAAVDVAYPAD